MYRVQNQSKTSLEALELGPVVGLGTVLRVVERGQNGVKANDVRRERKAYGLLRDLVPHPSLLLPDIVLPGAGSDPLYMTMLLCQKNITELSFDEDGALINFMGQLARGVRHLHKHNIAHFDIKGENVLLAQDNHYMLADFGVAVMCPNGRYMGKFNGTQGEVAPEMQCLYDSYGSAALDAFKCDVFGIGKTVQTLLQRSGQQNSVRADIVFVAALVTKSMENMPATRPSAADIAESIDLFTTNTY